MSRTVNSTHLIGNLTADPELRYTGSGTAVCNFSIATNESYKDASGEYVEKPTFHRCVAWGRLAEIITEYAKKGTRLYVQGAYLDASWDDKDGNRVNRMELKVQEFSFAGGRGSDSGETVEPTAAATEGGEDAEGDDLPF